MESLAVGTAIAKPGTIAEPGIIPVTRRASGDMVQLAVHVAMGRKPGPVLGLLSTSHGDEIFGAEVIREVFARLDLEKMSGGIVAIPVANPVAFESFTRTTGQGMNTDMNNLNRVFPGDATGWLTQQIAAAISTEFLPKIDYLIDFHSGGLETAIDYVLCEQEPGSEPDLVYELSFAFGTELVNVTYTRAHGGTLTQYATSLGKPSIIAEVGGNLIDDSAYMDRCVEGVFNVMKRIGILEGELVLPPTQRIIRKRTLIRAHRGGLFIPHVKFDKLAKAVPGGTVLATVVNPHTFEVEQVIEAPFEESYLIMLRGVRSRVNPGDYAYIIGSGEDSELIHN